MGEFSSSRHCEDSNFFSILVLSSKFMASELLFGMHALKIFSFSCRVNENTNLSTVLENHLQPSPWKNQIQKFCEQLDSLKFFVRTYPKVIVQFLWVVSRVFHNQSISSVASAFLW